MRKWVYLLIVILAYSCTDQIITARSQGAYISQEGIMITNWANGEAGNPYQYRVLSNYTTILLSKVLQGTGFTVSHIKIYQTIVIFILAFWWFGLYSKNPFFELLIFALVYTIIGCRNVFALDTWYDLIFCQLGMLAVYYKKYWWIIPLSVLGASNRETFLFFNLFFLVFAFYNRDDEQVGIAIISMVAFWACFLVIRLKLPYQDHYNTGYFGAHYGLDMFRSNLRLSAVTSFVGTLSFFSFFALSKYLEWDRVRMIGALVFIPCTLITLLVMGNVDETRVLIVPFTLFIMPGLVEAMCQKS